MADADSADLIANEQPQAVGEDATHADHVTVSLPDDVTTQHATVSLPDDVTTQHATVSLPDDVTPEHVSADTPVYYSTDGGVRVSHERVVVMGADGGATITTPRESGRRTGRQVKEKDLRFLKIFSAVTIPLFPPTGIAAFVYALRTEKAFYAGVRKGDMTHAERLSSTCERLIIFSLVSGLLLYVLIVAVAERSIGGHDTPYYGQGAMGAHLP